MLPAVRAAAAATAALFNAITARPRYCGAVNDDGIGCAACFGGSANDARAARDRLECRDRLVDESHFGVSIRACRACGQRFVHVFSEAIDWTGGNDPQSWLLIPVSAEEVDGLRDLDEVAIERAIVALSPKRRCLDEYWPPHGDSSVRWCAGPCLIMPHD